MKRYTLATFCLILFFLLIRLFIIGHLGLGDDEAYYWDWSRHLSLSYFDHPPLIAFLIALFVWIGGNSAFFVRLGVVLLFSISNILIFQICRRLFDEKAGFFAILLINIVPIYALGAIFAAPDGPLGFFFIASIYFFIRTQETNKNYNWYLWGVFLGLALLSKYNGALIVISYIFYFLLSANRSRYLKNPNIYVALLLAAVIFSPVIVWNYQNHWASFQFQFGGGHKGHFSIYNLLLFLGSQAGLLGILLYPLLILATVVAGYRGIKGKDEKYLLLFSLAAPTLILFHLASPFLSFKPHWTALGYLPMIICLVPIAFEKWAKNSVRIMSIAAVSLAFIFTAVIHIWAFHPILGGNIVPSRVDVTNELYGWKEVGDNVERLKGQMLAANGGDSVFLFSYRYQLVSQLAFYTPGQPEVFSLNSWLDAYDFFQDSRKLVGLDGIFVCDNRFDRKPDEFCNFDSLKQVEVLPIYRGGREVRKFYFYECFGFRGMK